MQRRVLLGLSWLLVVWVTPLCKAAGPPTVEQWVVVVPEAYEKTIAPLIEQRKSQGYRVTVIRVTDHLSFKDLLLGNGGPLRDAVRKQWGNYPGRSSVLLVGTATGRDSGMVPALRGTAGRMRNQLTDSGYGCREGSRMPSVAVGRFPARTVEELRGMVARTIALEKDDRPGDWKRRLTVLAGIPAYNPVVDRLVETVAFARFDRMHPSWLGRAIYTAEGSRFCLPDKELRAGSRALLAEGQAFILYLGHSSAEGLYAGTGGAFLDRDDWGKLPISTGQSVFLTFGCNSCQLTGSDGEGYGLAAIRNPRGPVAVLGSHGICYAAMVQLACEGLFQRAFTGKPAGRLGECWLATMEGIHRGSMDFLSYRMLDSVDGDPKTPQAAQRQEHLEMFTLLGDPALRLATVAEDLVVEPCKTVKPGRPLVVRGKVPDRLRGDQTKVEIRLLRGPASVPEGLQVVGTKRGAERDGMLRVNYRKANDFVLATVTVRVKAGGEFEGELKVPGTLPRGRMSIRATVRTDRDEALGVQWVEVAKD